MGSGEQVRSTPSGEVLIRSLPVGPVLASVPWNAPLVLGVVKLAPALLAGCPVVMKTAPETPLAALLLADAIDAAGFPDGVVSVLIGGGDVGRHLVAHPDITHVSFTGSTAVGKQVMASAAQNLTRVTLELGGKSASIILEDMDPAEGVGLVFGASLAQSGQVCTTSSRLLVPASRYDEWATALTQAFNDMVIGDPADPATQIGPLITAKQRETSEHYIRTAREEGATILAGGGRPEHLERGFYVQPTLIADVTTDMTVVKEEVFGPVITLQSYQDLDEAIALANATDYGLANAVFTHDQELGPAIARRLRSGIVSINNFGACLTEPFGGVGKSGIGREGGIEGFEEFLEIQQIQMAH